MNIRVNYGHSFPNKKTCYQSKLLYHYEILQEHSCREDRQLHPDGHHRLRLHLPHAILHKLTLLKRIAIMTIILSTNKNNIIMIISG